MFHGRLKAHGAILNLDIGQGGQQRADTVSCCHCGTHWEYTPGSGKVRGWCMQCNGFICGPACQDCVPKEQMLLNMEAGRDPKYRPLIVPGGFDKAS